MASWKTIDRKNCSFQDSDRKRYWQYYHDRNNQILIKHLYAHTMLLSVALQERSYKEVLRQTWLGIAVIPVHIRSTIREQNGSLS